MRIAYLSLVIFVTLRSTYCDFSEWEEQDNATATDLQYTKNVLICLHDDQWVPPAIYDILCSNFPEHQFHLNDMFVCSERVNENHNQSILAVVALKPLRGVDTSDIPMYFYGDSCSVDYARTRDFFPNAVMPGEWKSLRHAFSRFFEEQEWSRIAIISDNSWCSAAFEEELVRHFQEQQLVYHTERCVEVSPSQLCDFDEAVKYVKDHEAVIVIANVGYANALALLRAILAHSTTPQKGFVWLARDWRLSRFLVMDESFGEALSFTLAPKLRPEFSSLFAEGKSDVENNPPLTSLLHGLYLINVAVTSTTKNRIDYYYRDIERHMESNSVQMQAYVHKFVGRSSVVIAVGTVTNDDVHLHFQRPAFSTKIYDVSGCFLRSEVFEHPCDVTRLVILMLVSIISVIMIFLLAYFFNEYKSIISRESRYGTTGRRAGLSAVPMKQ